MAIRAGLVPAPSPEIGLGDVAQHRCQVVASGCCYPCGAVRVRGGLRLLRAQLVQRVQHRDMVGRLREALTGSLEANRDWEPSLAEHEVLGHISSSLSNRKMG